VFYIKLLILLLRKYVMNTAVRERLAFLHILKKCSRLQNEVGKRMCFESNQFKRVRIFVVVIQLSVQSDMAACPGIFLPYCALHTGPPAMLLTYKSLPAQVNHTIYNYTCTVLRL